MRADPNRPRLRSHCPGESGRDRSPQLDQIPEMAHEYLSQGNKWKCAGCGNYNARRVQVCDHCHKVRS